MCDIYHCECILHISAQLDKANASPKHRDTMSNVTDRPILPLTFT